MSSYAGPNQTSFGLTNVFRGLKLLRILSKDICREIFFLLAFSSARKLVEENGASVVI